MLCRRASRRAETYSGEGKRMDISERLAITLLGLALIGVSGAALLTGHATFDQFLGVAGTSGLIGAIVHALGLPTSSPSPTSTGGSGGSG